MGPVKRFVVAERSMEPALHEGDGLVAVRSPALRRGQLRCFEHPWQPGLWLVKRVGDIRGTAFEARSDNPGAGAVDSRRFGLVDAVGSYRVVLRIPRRWLHR